MKWTVRSGTSNHVVEVEKQAGGFLVTVDGTSRPVDYLPLDQSVASLRYSNNGHSFHVTAQRQGRRRYRVAIGEREFEYEVLTPVESVASEAALAAGGASRLEAPIPGKVVAVHVAAGDAVEAGQPLVVLEAMKMENELAAERAGTVAMVHVEPGQTVDSGTVLVDLEAE
jgi:biotin carboxyl carrier protein